MSAEITNTVTGEATITDDERGETHHIVFSIEAVAAVERMTNKGVLDIIGAGRPTLTETAMIVVAGSEGYRRRHPGQKPLNPKLALKLIAAAGYTTILPVVLESLIKAEGLGLRDDDEEAAPADDAGDDGSDPFAGD